MEVDNFRLHKKARQQQQSSNSRLFVWSTVCFIHCGHYAVLLYLQSRRREQAHRRRRGSLLLVLERHRRGKVEFIHHGEGIPPSIRICEDLAGTSSRNGVQSRRPLEEELLKKNIGSRAQRDLYVSNKFKDPRFEGRGIRERRAAKEETAVNMSICLQQKAIPNHSRINPPQQKLVHVVGDAAIASGRHQ